MGVLDDKVAIVTGSARGIGRATAELLSAQGAKVVINDLDGDVAQQTASEIAGETAVYAGDLTKGDAPDQLVQTAIDAWGKVDIIVNNAGYTLDAPIHKMSDDWWQKMLDIHVTVPFRVVRAAAPHLREPAKKEREQGVEVFRKIVNVSSISGTMGNAGQANYSAGKSAVVGLTKTLAKEWGQFKINVNAVAFGYIETRLTASKDDSNQMEIDGQKVQLGIPDQLRGMASMLIPLGRPGTPQEAAGGVFFLCSPWSNYVHGQTLNVTGGQFTGATRRRGRPRGLARDDGQREPLHGDLPPAGGCALATALPRQLRERLLHAPGRHADPLGRAARARRRAAAGRHALGAAARDARPREPVRDRGGRVRGRAQLADRGRGRGPVGAAVRSR
jgi:3-oxoacyl-[acyl-carrier protein] reductase